MTLEEQIAQLTDQQALSIVASLSGELGADAGPETEEEQARVLETALRDKGWSAAIDLEAASPEGSGEAARELLRLLSDVPEVRDRVAARVAAPPAQEALAVPMILAAPVVLTGCILLLQVAAHVHFERSSDGTWKVQYDPARRAPLDDVLDKVAERLTGVMGWFSKGGA